MACTRDRIINFLESLDIDVNVGKNKARGNKGFFRAHSNRYRIDVAKGLTEETEIRVLVHEFAHYLHYDYDTKLKDLSFVFDELTPELMEELLSITTESIDSKDIKPLFEQKEILKNEIRNIYDNLKSLYGNFDVNKPLLAIEKTFKYTNYRYLLKHDKVKVYKGFSSCIYSVENLDKYSLSEEAKKYVLLKSKQRMLRRINSKISRLNRYYNNPSELFARAFEVYILNREYMKGKYSLVNARIDNAVQSGKIDKLTDFVKLL